MSQNTMNQGFVQQPMPEQFSNQPQKQPNTKLIVTIILSVVAALVLIGGGGTLYYYISGNINGDYSATSLEKEFSKKLEETDSDYDSSIFDSDAVKAEFDVKIDGDKAVGTVKVSFDRDKLYKTYKEGIDSYDFSADELKKAGLPSNKEEFLDEFDSNIQDSIGENEFSYNSKTGTASATLFKGNVNRWSRSIVITDYYSSEDFLDDDDGLDAINALEKGKDIHYKKTSSGIVLEGKDDNIDLDKDN
ncbi:hypothetical protein ACVR1G_10490 [Streptococcus dentasini]